jgi:transposase
MKKKISVFERLRHGNRAQRKETNRLIEQEDPSLEVVHRDAAGIDVGGETHMVAVPRGRDEQPVREFGAWTDDLRKLIEWLKQCGIRTVVMQSTGVYWVPLLHELEAAGFRVFLVNARHTKNLPGRKTDVLECQWLMRLHTYGLLRDSFHPPAEIDRLRRLWRQRDDDVKQAARCIQQMQKALVLMNVQLHNAISDLSGKTGQGIIQAILRGERDAQQLAVKYRDPRIQASVEEIARSLEGRWDEEGLHELQRAVDAFAFYQQRLVECDERTLRYLQALPTKTPKTPVQPAAGAPVAAAPASPTQPEKRRRKKRSSKLSPSIDFSEQHQRIFGVDLTRIPGIDVVSAQTVLSELGPDLHAWATEKHFTSWLGLAPRPRISGGRVLGYDREPVRNRVAEVLRLAATTLLKSQSYLGARYRYLRMTRGAAIATKAMARQLACLIYRTIRYGQEWVDRGAAEFEQKRRQRELASLQRKAAQLGFTIQPAA